MHGLSNFFTAVLDVCIWRTRRFDAGSMSTSHEYDAETSGFDHLRKNSLASADRQGARAIFPVDRYYGVLAFLVVIAIACVFIKIELSVGATIDTEFDGTGRILCGVFDRWTQRKNRSRTHEEWHAIQGRIRFDLPAARDQFTGPEVVPSGRCRKVNASFGCIGLQHRIDQQIGAEH